MELISQMCDCMAVRTCSKKGLTELPPSRGHLNFRNRADTYWLIALQYSNATMTKIRAKING